VRPRRSAYRPPSQHPIAPIPTTQNVISAATPRTSSAAPRRTVSLAATKLAVHVHIAYSSHMCPRYPAFASSTARSRRILGAAVHENGGGGAAYGPSDGTRSIRAAPSQAATAAATRPRPQASAGDDPPIES